MTSPFSPEFGEMWNGLSADLEPQRPSVGKTVKVVKGRKHVGETGIVIWHGESNYDATTRFLEPAQLYMRQIKGRSGYRVGIETATGERFFVNAEYVEVISS